jgi:aryl-alcohol dehydrogenase-like predicted oxidoreductase
MDYRDFNKSNFKCSEIGLGTWQLGGADWGDIDDETALKILNTALEHGVNFFDTADVYGMGRSESLIGSFIKETSSNKPFIATKLGRFPHPGWPENFRRETIRKHTEASLQRLGIEAIDLTQLHCIPTEQMRDGEIFEWLRELKQEGKVKHFGASVESMEEAHICLEQEGISSLQIIFNIFRQKPIEEIFNRAIEKRVAIIVRLPLASGLLSGKFTKETTFDAKDHRNYNQEGKHFNVGETFAGIPFEQGVELVDELKSMVPEGMSMAQMAMRWILDFEAVSVVIPGAKRVNQVIENVRSSDIPPLSEELHSRLSKFYKERVSIHIRGAY